MIYTLTDMVYGGRASAYLLCGILVQAPTVHVSVVVHLWYEYGKIEVAASGYIGRQIP